MNVIALDNKYQKWRCNGSSDRNVSTKKKNVGREHGSIHQLLIRRRHECVLNNVNIKRKKNMHELIVHNKMIY